MTNCSARAHSLVSYARAAFACALAWAGANLTSAAESGAEVVVVYNQNLPESKGVAIYYAQRRGVPDAQIIGLNLPKGETMTRAEYDERLSQPLLKHLRDAKLFIYRSSGKRREKSTNEVPVQASVRYAALCYGVPLKILSDSKLNEPGADQFQPQLRRNDAAVDNELALLPNLQPRPLLTGPVANRFYGTTNGASLHPTNGILLVTRLDGPSPEIARGLVDKAMEAETNGLWGRAYFDARGFTNSSYKIGDDWIRGAAQVTARFGYETVLDNDPATFSPSFPMSQIAFYAGWYDGAVSGPFTRPTVEFMPGAFAYHLHSFSAQTIRSSTANWVGPLLAKGASITMGCVEEPYLEGTPDILTFMVRFTFGAFSFGEAAYACQNSLSWQTTVVGDPLYRPFAIKPLDQYSELYRRHSKLITWSHLKVVNMNLATGLAPEKLIEYLEGTPDTYSSAILLEKLGDLYFMRAKWPEAATNYRKALLQQPTPQQRVRLYLALARNLELAGDEKGAMAVYEEFVKTCPDYPDLLAIYKKLLPLTERLGTPENKAQCEKAIERLSPSAPAAK